MLTDHIESEILGLLDVILQCFVGRSGVKSVRPPTLVKRSELEESLTVQTHKFCVAVLLENSNLTHGGVGSDPVDNLSVPEDLDVQTIEIW